MELLQDTKQLISDAKNVCVIPSQDIEGESAVCALALFYTLRELGKNVNVLTDDFPEKFNFLIPSLEHISQPKNFVISIPRNVADVSQIYYEKNDENLKIHLTVSKGGIKKDNIAFYFADPKPDLIITLGVQSFREKLTQSLDAFGFLLDVPIINIDNNPANEQFGKVNIITDSSLSEMVFDMVNTFDQKAVNKNAANCLLAGLLVHYENFKSQKTHSHAFRVAGMLVEHGASNEYVAGKLYKSADQETSFWGAILQNLAIQSNGLSVSAINSTEFQNMTEAQTQKAVEKVKLLGIQNDLLVLWKSHASAPMIKGFFYSKETSTLNKVMQAQGTEAKQDWISIKLPGKNIAQAKEEIIHLI